MKLILKYMKPFLIPAAICIIFLFARTIMDLMLPNYMSDIVNVGIMKSGIEEESPKIMSETAYKLLCSFMDDSEKAVFERSYSLSEPNSPQNDALQKEFPLINDGAVYILSNPDPALTEAYSNIVMTLIITISSNNGDEYSLISDSNFSPEDISKVYAVLSAVNPADTIQAREEALRTASLMKIQTAITLTKLFYSELGADLPQIQQNSIMSIGGIMLIISLIGVVVNILVGFFSARVSSGIGRKLRHDVYEKVCSFTPAEFDNFSTASLITRNTNDVQQVQMMSMLGLRMICSAPIMGIGGIVMAIQKSASLSWIIAVAVIVLVGFQIILFNVVVPKFKLMQKLLDKLNLVSRENLTGMMVIRAFGNENKEAQRFDSVNVDITKTNRFVQRVMAIMDPTMNFVMGCTTLLIVWLGGHAVASSSLQIGDMLAFMQYVMQIIMAFLMIAMMFIMIPRALVSASRIRDVLDTDSAVKDRTNLKSLRGRAKGELRFNNVSFKYNNAEAPVLENITFTAKPGQTLAFIGSTGSGKSTLINLIPRFYDVSDGSIEIDGVDIRDLSQRELRSNIGYVPQKGILFSGSVFSNLSYGKENASDDDFRQALHIAQGEDFVYNDKEGLSTEISQGGDNVSGGQKQRLSIARALVKNPPIYIFDDSFSALDFKTDAALRKALREYTSDATVLIVAQRVSTIMNAHQIVVLDAGKIVGIGTHSELLTNCLPYREIAESQLSKEELA